MKRYIYGMLRCAAKIIALSNILFLISCSNTSCLIGKDFIIPNGLTVETDYAFIHIIRNQKCIDCSLNSLHIWNSIINMIGRDDISYFFIVEMLHEDTTGKTSKTLFEQRFNQKLFEDYSHQCIEQNPWLKKRKFSEVNDFIIDKSGKIIKIGDPYSNFGFLIEMKKM